MEFNKKIQELRKKKGITQEELAEAIYVSRTAVSKWESGKGYPSIDSLKTISKYFNVTVDELLSGDELINLAEETNSQKENSYRDLVFGLLDISTLIFLFLPLFKQNVNNAIQEVSLINLSEIAPYLKIGYYLLCLSIFIYGILTLALQNFSNKFSKKYKSNFSILLNIIGIILFIISQQPYPATLLLVYLIIKVLIYLKK